jgi:hypothetical protein
MCCLVCGTGLSKTLNYEQITLYCRHIISKKGANWDHINWFKPATMLCISYNNTIKLIMKENLKRDSQQFN